jgi:hypothetical protein
MSKRAWLVGSALSLVALAVTIAPSPGRGADPAPAAEAAPPSAPAPQAAPEPEHPAGFSCNDKPVTGTGPGFDSSRDHSEQTAKEAWLVKARAIFTDAAWDTAKGFNVTCVKQGLYSKCFATAVPCGATKATASDTPKADTPKSN